MGIQAIFAENMRKYRKKARLTQEKLAELCGSDHRYIGQIETGLRSPSLEFAEKVAAALKVAPYQLFYDETYHEDTEILTLRKAHKQKVKAKVFESFTEICAMIDEV